MPLPQKPHDEAVLTEALRAYQDAGGNKAEAARALGIPTNTFRNRIRAAQRLSGVNLKKLEAGGEVEPMRARVARMPRRGEVKRYILTSAQNNTKVWQGIENLKALADHYGAKLMVGTFSYKLSSYGTASVKRGAATRGETPDETWYDPAVVPYICDERVQLAPGLVWCGEQNILPTATDPLAQLDTYAGRQSCIVPHARIEMRSVKSGKTDGTKMNYTTGTVTQRNYIKKRAGLLADFAHCYGGVIVEVKPDGRWYVRQLHAGEDDSIYDLNLRAQAGVVAECGPKESYVDSITWGDIHEISLQPSVRRLMFGPGGILDTFRPKRQFMHDVLDFRSRNHHDMKNSHLMFEKHVTGVEDVEAEVRGVWKFLARESRRPWCETVVVPSNHDEALTRWLREADFKADPVNSIFYLERELAKRRAIRARDLRFLDLEDALTSMGAKEMEGVRFLRRDEDFVTCKTGTYPGNENGLHGDTWANLNSYSRPLTIGHRHAAGIRGTLYVAGISGSLDQGYNVGPSDWSQTHVFTYPNGRRTLVTMWKGDYRG